MSRFLARIGSFAYRKPLVFILIWALLVVGVVGLISGASPQLKTTMTVDGTPAQDAMDTVAAELPEASGGQGSIILTIDDAEFDSFSDDAGGAALAQVANTAYGIPEVVNPTERTEAARADARQQALDAATVEAAATITGQMTALSDALSTQISELDQRAAQLPPMQAEAARASAAQLGALREDADHIATLDASAALTATDQFVASLRTLSQNSPQLATQLRDVLPQSGSDTGVDLASIVDSGQSISALLEEKVDGELDSRFSSLASLQAGPNPSGRPLVVDGESVPGVTISQDETTALFTLQLTEATDDLLAGRLAEITGEIEATAGAAGLSAELSQSLIPLTPPIGGQEVIGLVIAAIILLITLGSLVAAGLPILTAVIGVVIGVGGAFGFSEFYTMTSTTSILALMLGLAVGIDYALFILNKQRHYILHSKLDAHEATARAVGTAGTAVVFAGSTVIIALLGLLVVGIEFVTTMAVVAAATVFLAVLIAITLLPSLLGLVKERIVSTAARERVARREMNDAGGSPKPRFSHRWVSFVTKRPWLTIIGVVALLAVVAIPVTDMRLGMPSGAVADADTTQRIHYDSVSDNFGEGMNGPLIGVVTRDPQNVSSMADAATATAPFQAQRNVIDQIMALPGVANASFRGQSADGTLELYQIIPEKGPIDPATEELVHSLRDGSAVGGVASFEVTGLTAINIDLSEALGDALGGYIAIVVALSLIILLLAFRSLIIPLAATAGFLLTLAATLGIVTAVFGTADLGFIAGIDRPGVVLSFLPMMATGILYGLAMDYQIFLTTSIREEYARGTSARAAVITGFTHSARVILAAATIMVSVFAAFILSDEIMVRQFGLALAAGILIDALLVRMTLMPALIYTAGKWAWYLPRWLERILPHLDIEGSQLDAERSQLGHARSQPEGEAAQIEPATVRQSDHDQH